VRGSRLKRKLFALLFTSIFLFNGVMFPLNAIIYSNHLSFLNSQTFYFSLINQFISNSQENKNEDIIETRQNEIPQNIEVIKSENPFVKLKRLYEFLLIY